MRRAPWTQTRMCIAARLMTMRRSHKSSILNGCGLLAKRPRLVATASRGWLEGTPCKRATAATDAAPALHARLHLCASATYSNASAQSTIAGYARLVGGGSCKTASLLWRNIHECWRLASTSELHVSPQDNILGILIDRNHPNCWPGLSPPR